MEKQPMNTIEKVARPYPHHPTFASPRGRAAFPRGDEEAFVLARGASAPCRALSPASLGSDRAPSAASAARVPAV